MRRLAMWRLAMQRPMRRCPEAVRRLLITLAALLRPLQRLSRLLTAVQPAQMFGRASASAAYQWQPAGAPVL
jgi:hypothetical protein